LGERLISCFYWESKPNPSVVHPRPKSLYRHCYPDYLWRIIFLRNKTRTQDCGENKARELAMRWPVLSCLYVQIIVCVFKLILLSKLEKYSVHTQKSIKDFAVFLKKIYIYHSCFVSSLYKIRLLGKILHSFHSPIFHMPGHELATGGWDRLASYWHCNAVHCGSCHWITHRLHRDSKG
jgi:hypothetical protein